MFGLKVSCGAQSDARLNIHLLWAGLVPHSAPPHTTKLADSAQVISCYINWSAFFSKTHRLKAKAASEMPIVFHRDAFSSSISIAFHLYWCTITQTIRAGGCTVVAIFFSNRWKTLSLQIRCKLKCSLCHQSLNPPLCLWAKHLRSLFLSSEVPRSPSSCIWYSGLLRLPDITVANTSGDRWSLNIVAEK